MANNPKVERLRSLANMGTGELRSRANALPELLAAVREVLPLLDAADGPASAETSEEVATLAGSILETELEHIGPASQKGARLSLATFHSWAQSVAGSALRQYVRPSDPNQAALPLDDAAERSLIDAQQHGQAQPLTRTVVVGPGSTGPNSPGDEKE